MTRFLLLRHGTTDAVGRRLVGRLRGIPLNDEGRRQAEAAARGLEHVAIEAVYASPLERALDTARAVARSHGLDVLVRDGLTDVDFGAWTGASIAELQADPAFELFNSHRSSTWPPGGEHVSEVQARMLRELLAIREERPHATVALVGHADPLRVAAALFLGMPIDYVLRLEIAPGSVSGLVLEERHTALLFWNRPGSSSFDDLARR